MPAPLRTPRALQLPCADLNPPSRAPSPAETANQAGAARRQAPEKRGRAGAEAGLAREERQFVRQRSLACPRGGGKTRPDSLARGRPTAGPRPPDVGGGERGHPRPLRANLSPARGLGSSLSLPAEMSRGGGA